MKLSTTAENRPGYKKTKIGWIPEEWEEKTVESLFSESRVFSSDTESFPLHSFTIEDGVVPKTDRYERRFLLRNREENEFKIVSYGDIVFNPMNLRFGAIALSKVPKDVTVSSYYIVLRGKRGVDARYYSELFRTFRMLHVYNSIAIGSLIEKRRVHWSILSKVKIPLPPLPEQKKIAEILSTWDRAIELVDKLITAKERLKKGLMQKLLTGKLRFPGFHSKWRKVRLGEVFKERNETNYNELPLLAITGSKGVIYRDVLERKDTSNVDKSKYKRICRGDIGYNTMRMWQGVSALSTLEGIVSPAYTIVIPQRDIYGVFASYLFKLKDVIFLFYRYSQGLVNDTWNLKFNHFCEVAVKIPQSVLEQQKITLLLSTCDQEIKLLKREKASLEQQKKGLMQKLLTGETRVKIKTNIC